MINRIAPLTSALFIALSACPGPANNPDGGPDGNGNQPSGDCSAPCGPNQVCDPVHHVCVEACQGACGEGEICIVRNGSPTCETVVTSCNGTFCSTGQTSCVAGNCSCLPYTMSTRDTCAASRGICRYPFNPVTNQGGTCDRSRTFEYCDRDCVDCAGTSPTCPLPNGGTARRCSAQNCPAGHACSNLVTGDYGVCIRNCASADCSEGEICASNNGGRCLPPSFFSGQGCKVHSTLPDGGPGFAFTVAGNHCLFLNPDGGSDETTPSGTCDWVMFVSDVNKVPVDYCRLAGDVSEHGACKTDLLPAALTNTCDTALVCSAVGRGNDGICLPSCFTGTGSEVPASAKCGSGEACVNIHRDPDVGNALGACMTTCDVFSTAANYGCSPYGSRATSCVPVDPAGILRISPSGRGLCIPQLADPKGEGIACVETDAFRGAACLPGLICAQVDGSNEPRCVKPCDLECSADGGPSRCDTESNARCGSGTCTRVASSVARLGFCL